MSLQTFFEVKFFGKKKKRYNTHTKTYANQKCTARYNLTELTKPCNQHPDEETKFHKHPRTPFRPPPVTTFYKVTTLLTSNPKISLTCF